MRLTQVNNKGRVGIGVTVPLAQLHTNADVMFTGITNNNSLSNVLVQDNAGQIFWRAASTLSTSNNWSLGGNSSTDPLTQFLGTNDNTSLVIKTNATERMTITANGNIGLNNNNPIFKLEIASATQNNHLRLSGNSPAIVLVDGNNTPTQFNAGDLGIATFPTAFVPTSKVGDLVLRNYGNGAVSSGASSDLVLAAGRNYSSGNNNSVEIMRLSQVAGKGKVGIGTTAPTAQLHTTDSIRFENLPNGTGTYLVIDADGYIWKSTTTAPAKMASSGPAPIEKSQMEILLLEVAKLRSELEEIKAKLLAGQTL
ncbi:MAG: hypothetical protein Q7T76_11680 [Ferruginibacter sp.]|nr:hypothetical protein [Ferruginibacter sp.]